MKYIDLKRRFNQTWPQKPWRFLRKHLDFILLNTKSRQDVICCTIHATSLCSKNLGGMQLGAKVNGFWKGQSDWKSLKIYENIHRLSQVFKIYIYNLKYVCYSILVFFHSGICRVFVIYKEWAFPKTSVIIYPILFRDQCTVFPFLEHRWEH